MLDLVFGRDSDAEEPSAYLGRLCLFLSGSILATAIGYLLGVHILAVKIIGVVLSYKTPSLVAFGILTWIIVGGYLVSRYQWFRHCFVIGSASAVALGFWWLFSKVQLDNGSTPVPLWLGATIFASSSLFAYCYKNHAGDAEYESFFEIFFAINGVALALGFFTLYFLSLNDQMRARSTAITEFTRDFPDASTNGAHRYEIGRHKFECYYSNFGRVPKCED